MEGFHNGSNFSNTSVYAPYAGDSTAERTLKVLAYCLIILMSLIGNSLVITVIYKDRRLNTNTNRFIVNMCASDILMTLWVLPERVTFILAGQWLISGDMGDFLCKMVALIQDVSAGVSIFSMATIAFDRFFAIVLPFRTHFITTKRCYLMICCTWVLSIVIHIPYLFFNQVIQQSFEHEPSLACRQIWPDNLEAMNIPRKYYLTSFSLLFMFPLLSIAVFYTAVIIELSRKSIADQNAEQQRIRQRENREVSFMLITVVVLFAFSWAPINTLAFMFFFGDRNFTQSPWIGTFRFVADFTMHANAAQNAIIYFTFNNRFKQGLKRILSSRRHRNTYESQSNGSITLAKRWNVKMFHGKRDEDTKEERFELTTVKANEV